MLEELLEDTNKMLDLTKRVFDVAVEEKQEGIADFIAAHSERQLCERSRPWLFERAALKPLTLFYNSAMERTTLQRRIQWLHPLHQSLWGFVNLAVQLHAFARHAL